MLHYSWRLEDSIMMSRMVGFLGLQQTQKEAESLLIELVRADVNIEYLSELFPGLLDGLDREIIKKLKLEDNLVPPEVWKVVPFSPPRASNNWAVSGKKSESGSPVLAGDPHMDISRLPNIWQEFVLQVGDRYIMGASIPGIPGILIGRNNNVAWSATYSFMDAIDSWIEDCREGKARRGSKQKTQWSRFRERWEVIKRKRKKDHNITFYENEHGVLDGNPFEEGHYLATRWASGEKTGALSLETVFSMLHVRDVRKGMDLLGQMETSWNWVLADDQDNIAYQMSGLKPKRHTDVPGFVPMPGWEARYDWKGFEPYKNLPRKLNPRDGYIVTANNDLNEFGKTNPINLPMGPYRADRIAQVLKYQKKLSISDMIALQYDDYSLQAEQFMRLIFPLLPDTEHGQILANWDCRYHFDSQGAFLFEKFYRELIRNVFGSVLGYEAIDYIMDKTTYTIFYYYTLDRILLKENSLWFLGRDRSEIYSEVLEKVLTGSIKKWGTESRFTMRNMILSEKLPRFFRVDRGAYMMSGGRATPLQIQISKSSRNPYCIGPSYRMIVDFAENGIRTNMPGGSLDRPFSLLYNSDTDNWLKMRYKELMV